MVSTAQIKPVTTLTAFASSDEFDPKLQSFLHEACSQLCKWLGDASNRGPLPLGISFPNRVAPNQHGLSADELLGQLRLIMEGSYQPSHPGALAHLDPPPLTACIASELICAGLNNNLLAEELSPSLSRLERDLCRWFANCLGLPSTSSGVAASGGSLSNLMALVVARYQAGLNSDPKAVVIASADAHISFVKAIRVMGLMDDALVMVPTDANGIILLDELDNIFNELNKKGRKCIAVVATAGTTTRGAIDPLQDLSAYCSGKGVWLHVDAAIGGVFALSEATSSLVSGISKADSVTLNPQKVLGIPKTSSLLLVAQSIHLKQAFSTGLPYMEPAWGEAHGGEMGLQGSRAAEVLKLWLGLMQLGDEGISELLERAIKRRCYLEEKLDSLKFNIVSGPLHLISFSPKGIDRNEASKWSASTRKSLLENNIMLSRPFYQDRYYLKVVLGNPHTTTAHLDKLTELLGQSLVE